MGSNLDGGSFDSTDKNLYMDMGSTYRAIWSNVPHGSDNY